MVLHSAPYTSACLHFLDGLSWSLVFPCYWLLDRLLASCVATSLEKRQRAQDPCSFLSLCVLIAAPLYLLLFFASLPFALLGFIIWAPLQAVRQPYLYTYPGPGGGGTGEWRPQGRSFCFCSANVCLLPDSLARFNNLSDTHRRAREVGKRIRNGASRPQIKIYIDSPTNTSISAASFSSLATGFRRTSSLDHRPDQTPTTNGPADTETEPLTECPIHPSGAADCPIHPSAADQCPTGNHREAGGDSMTASRESLARYHGDSGVGISSNNTLSHVPRTSIFKRPGRKRRHGDETFDHEISAFFPANLDFLALQEVFDHGATSRLRRQLHRYFPYVLSDVGRYGWKGCCSRFKFLNSGLMLASRYPILDARYECYPNGRGEDALAAKGALFAKVRVDFTFYLLLWFHCCIYSVCVFVCLSVDTELINQPHAVSLVLVQVLLGQSSCSDISTSNRDRLHRSVATPSCCYLLTDNKLPALPVSQFSPEHLQVAERLLQVQACFSIVLLLVVAYIVFIYSL
uniref:sphingomyelin phosphodiesterase n=1 Tax=Stegastes partitus TaxID=144197 RepID=A0A3B4ZLJ5_9TELE